jgi:hypothetical protein
MKMKITLTLDAALLRQVRAVAVERSTSVSELLSECLEHVVGRRPAYARSRKRALARLRKGPDLNWTPPRSRDELHKR